MARGGGFGPKKPRQKRSVSCQNCREVKLKCLRLTPGANGCHRCEERGLICSGPTPTLQKLRKREFQNQDPRLQERGTVSFNQQNHPGVPRFSQALYSHTVDADAPNTAHLLSADAESRHDRADTMTRRLVLNPHEPRFPAVPDSIADAQATLQEQPARYSTTLYERHAVVAGPLEAFPEEEQCQLARSSYQKHHLMRQHDSRNDAQVALQTLHRLPSLSYDRTVSPYAGPSGIVPPNYPYGSGSEPSYGSEPASDYENWDGGAY